MTRTRRAAALAVLLVGASAVSAQPAPPAELATLKGESPQTRKRLAEAEQKVNDGKAADAVDDLQRILDEAGDDLILVAGRQHRPARWVAHQILAKLPADALKAYRDRIDEPARRLLDAGRRDRDPRPLWQLLDRYFVSRPAEDGLLLLGDLLFERGEFRTAELLWRRLLPDADADVPYPTPKADPAAVGARVVLAVVFQGERDRAKTELTAFKTKHAKASGLLAGKTGPYADVLQAFLDRPPPPAPEAGGDRAWPTFGGDPGRTGRVHGPIPVRWPTNPRWQRAIPPTVREHRFPIRPAARTAPGTPPFGHPVIVGGHVYLTDGDRVVAYELTTGRLIPIYEPGRFELPGLPGRPTVKPTDPDACCTLTAAGGRLYARLGPPVVRAPDPARKGAEESALVCLAPWGNAGKAAPPVRELWRVPPPDLEGRSPGVWEGAPLVAGRRMWAAVARFEGGRVVHSVACFDPADAEKAPDRPAWVVEVCDSPLSPGAEARTRQELLTLAGRNVVLCSNTGAVVALDAATGRRAWGFQYPRTTRRAADANHAPDPAPAVAAGGRVFVAPVDADRVYALDAETGALLWESGLAEGAQILGVTRNRLVLTTTGPFRGIRALSVVTGSHRGADGWVTGADMLGYGRGFVTDDVVVWPSRDGLWFIDPSTGQPLVDPYQAPAAPPLNGLFGNLAYAAGWLVVVTPTQVWGYEADGPPFVHPRPDAEPQQLFGALVDEAERDLVAGNSGPARELLAKATRSDLPAAWRAWAAARLLLLGPPVDDAAKLPADVRDLLTPELLREWLVTSDGELVSLEALVARQTGRAPPPRGVPVPPTLPAERGLPEAPGLGADSHVVRTVRLPPSAVPLRPIPGAATPPRHAFIASGRDLLLVSLADGKQATHAAADEFTHAADLPDGFVAAGPLAVAVYGTTRDPAWVFRVPDTDPLPGPLPRVPFRSDHRPPPPELSAFTLTGDWLLARLGDRHLLALDLKGRRVAWVLGAHGRPRYEPHLYPTTPRLESCFLVTGRLVVAQLSDGRRWMVQLETGRVWGDDGSTFARAVPDGFGARTAVVPWVRPPAEVESNRLAFPDGAGLVRFVSLASGRVKCEYEAGGESSLAGDPPQVRAWGDAVLVAIRRNYGVELDRVDPLDGKSAWAGGPAFLDTGRIDLGAADTDPQRVFIPVGKRLLALGLDDGKPVWDAELPAGGAWVVRAGRRAVVAYPAEALPDEPFGVVWDRVGRSFGRSPLPWRLPLLAATAYDSWTDRAVPVLLFDPETGQLLKRLTVPARGPALTAWLDGERAVVATGDRVVWLR
jgi:outer membrane protein assembly factor BamB